tara:strand:+ start:441 stop:614 length:174 start_codon:yes stop_codon:yes gene_type:complete
MSISYKLYPDYDNGSSRKAIQKTDGDIISSIPFDPDNTDYQEYLAWVAEGNTPEAAG